MSERVSMAEMVTEIYRCWEDDGWASRLREVNITAAREVDDLLVDLNARLNDADVEQARLRAEIERLVGNLNECERDRQSLQFEVAHENLLRENDEQNKRIVALEERRFALIERHATEQLAVINRNTDALEKIAAVLSREKEKQDATGEVLRKVNEIQEEFVSRLDAARRFAVWWNSKTDREWDLKVEEHMGEAFIAGFLEAKSDLVHVPLDKEAIPSSPSDPPQGNHEVFHVLWSRAVGTEGYDKSLWLQLDRALFPGCAP